MTINISLTAPINQLSYGLVSQNIIKALTDQGVNVSLFPINTIRQEDVIGQNVEVITKAIKNAEFFQPDASSLRVWHQNNLAQHVGSGLRIGFPFFELDQLTDLEKHHLNSVDRLFVASKWAKTVLERHLDNPDVRVVPLGVNRDIFKELPLPISDRITFINIGKWEVRKGHDIIPEVFHNAFKDVDDVQLIMCCDNPFLNHEEKNKWISSYKNILGNKVTILPRVSTQQELVQLIQAADCGIFPARAEGWNLDLLEVMSCGRHAITLNYSAPTEYCNNDNSYLIEIEKVVPAYDGKWFFNQGNWAHLGQKQLDDLSSSLRSFYEKQKANRTLNYSGIATARNFTWNNTANHVIKNIF